MSRRMSSMVAVVIAAGLFAALLCLFTAPALAQSTPNTPAAPEAPGSIAGVVTDAGGTPLADIQVELYRSYPGASFPERTLTTDAAGAYRAGVLGTGAYRVLFWDPAGVYGQSYYSDAFTLESAASIAVVGNDITGIDGVLHRAGAITGVYSQAVDLLPTSVEIAALVASDTGWQSAKSTYVLTTGGYSLTGLAPGVYRVCATHPYLYPAGGGPLPAPSVCYDNVISSIDNAQPVTVSAGVTTTNINLTAGVEGDGAMIGGSVRTLAGDALENVEVTLIRRTAEQDDAYLQTINTDAAGIYTFRRVRPGVYFVKFDDRSGPYLPTYYGSAQDIDAATPIVVDRFEARLDIDAALEMGAALRGSLRILGTEKPAWASPYSVRVDIGSGGTNEQLWRYGIYDPATGMYSIGGLRPSRYVIEVTAYLGSNRFYGYYGGETFETATVLSVTTGDILTGLDINLGEGMFDGAITGQVTSGGVALPGIKVSLFPSSSNQPELVHVFTDADGRYAFNGLQQNGYRVGFSDPAQMYATTYYSNSIHLGGAQDIYIGTDEPRSGIDARLEPGGFIRGNVRLDQDTPAAGYTVRVWCKAPQDEQNSQMAQSATTDAQGNYQVAALPAGVYRVCVSSSPLYAGWRSGCYGGPLLVYDYHRAQDVPVRAGEETAGINIYLAQKLPNRSFLPMVAQSPGNY